MNPHKGEVLAVTIIAKEKFTCSCITHLFSISLYLRKYCANKINPNKREVLVEETSLASG
jgi:hypothetical protein